MLNLKNYWDTLKVLATIFDRNVMPPGIYLIGLGGIPFLKDGTDITYCNSVISVNTIGKFINQALGLSAELTYENPRHLSLETLGSKVKNLGHTFAYRWITLSFLVVSPENGVELAFLRDGRFRTSWCETNCNDFLVHGTLADFIYFCDTKGDRECSVVSAMLKLNAILAEIKK